jgi:hypothetical protein
MENEAGPNSLSSQKYLDSEVLIGLKLVADSCCVTLMRSSWVIVV